jgi:hypothetical protein
MTLVLQLLLLLLLKPRMKVSMLLPITPALTRVHMQLLTRLTSPLGLLGQPHSVAMVQIIVVMTALRHLLHVNFLDCCLKCFMLVYSTKANIDKQDYDSVQPTHNYCHSRCSRWQSCGFGMLLLSPLEIGLVCTAHPVPELHTCTRQHNIDR